MDNVHHLSEASTEFANDSRAVPQPISEDGNCPSDLGVGVWQKCVSRTPVNKAHIRRVAILGRDLNDLTSVEEGAGRLLADVYLSSRLRPAFWDIVRSPQHWAGIMMLYSHFGPIGQTFDLIHSFRLRVPSVPLILLSRELSGDDFSTERLPICDVSLKLPFDLTCFVEVMDLAESNNRVWIERNGKLSSVCEDV